MRHKYEENSNIYNRMLNALLIRTAYNCYYCHRIGNPECPRIYVILP